MLNGLMPSIIKNEWHLESFRSCGLKGNKLLYTWSPEYGASTSKYVMDMIYCKQFIHPRNDLFDVNRAENTRRWKNGTLKDWDDSKNWIDFSKMGNTIFGGDQAYDLFELNIEWNDLFGGWRHVQVRDDEEIFSTTNQMDDEYAHDDKEIFLIDKTIKPESIKLVNGVNSRVFKNKIHFNYTKS